MTNKEFLKFLYNCVSKYKYKLALLYIINFIFKNFIPYYILPYILKIISDSYEAKTLTMKYGFLLIFLYAFFYFVDYLTIAIITSKLSYRTEHQIEKDTRVNLFTYSLRHSINYFNNTMSDNLASKINNVSINIMGLLNKFILLFADFLSIIIIFFVYLKINIYLSIFFMLWCFLFFLITYINLKRLNEYSLESSKENNKISGIINDVFSNIINVKSFSNKRNEIKNVKKHNVILLKKDYLFIKNLNLTDFMNFLMLLFLISVVFITSFYFFHIKLITLGTFVFLCQNIISLKSSIISFSSVLFDSIKNISDIKVGISDILKPIEIKNKEDAYNIKNIKGRIVFKNITFRY